MSENPSSRFFWNDYYNDKRLAASSLAAQGLWMRMLCICACAKPVGHLVLQGRPLSAADLARLVGETEETVTALLAELERNGVFSRTPRRGIIFNRRLVRAEKRARTNKENGVKGGARKHRANNANLAFGNRIPSEPPSDAATPSTSSISSTLHSPSENREPPEYVWQGTHGRRLTHTSWAQWRDAYRNLSEADMRRELMKADAYFGEPDKRWFYRFSSWLERADKEAAAAREPPRTGSRRTMN